MLKKTRHYIFLFAIMAVALITAKVMEWISTLKHGDAILWSMLFLVVIGCGIYVFRMDREEEKAIQEADEIFDRIVVAVKHQEVSREIK